MTGTKALNKTCLRPSPNLEFANVRRGIVARVMKRFSKFAALAIVSIVTVYFGFTWFYFRLSPSLCHSYPNVGMGNGCMVGRIATGICAELGSSQCSQFGLGPVA